MKRISAIIAALALSVSLAGCGSNSQTSESNQASAIKAACDLAISSDYEGTRDAFSIIAANDSGYIKASAGAKYWAESKGQWFQTSWIPDMVPIIYESVSEFYALCNFK